MILLPAVQGAWTDRVLLPGAFPLEGSLGQRRWPEAGRSTDSYLQQRLVQCSPECLSKCPPESKSASEAEEAACRESHDCADTDQSEADLQADAKVQKRSLSRRSSPLSSVLSCRCIMGSVEVGTLRHGEIMSHRTPGGGPQAVDPTWVLLPGNFKPGENQALPVRDPGQYSQSPEDEDFSGASWYPSWEALLPDAEHPLCRTRASWLPAGVVLPM